MDHVAIHEKAVALAKEYEATESKLIEILQIVNQEKVYKKMGYTSLFNYAVDALELPPERVYQLNIVAKKCDEVPELKQAIDQGVLNVSRARRIASVIDRETSQDWIAKAATLTQRELEKEVARVNPKEALPERTKVLNATEAHISLCLSIEAKEQLERLKDVLSQKEKKPVGLKDAIEYAARFTLDRVDPLKRAERNSRKAAGSVRLSSRIKSRAPIPASLKHQILLRDNGQCTQIVEGKRCPSRRWLDIHHVIPVSKGGKNELENLATLCSSHHQMQHVPGADEQRMAAG